MWGRLSAPSPETCRKIKVRQCCSGAAGDLSELAVTLAQTATAEIEGFQGARLHTERMAHCSVAGAGLQAASRGILASAGRRCSSAAQRAPLVGGRAAVAVAARRRQLVLFGHLEDCFVRGHALVPAGCPPDAQVCSARG